jgi:putative transposase
MEFAHRALPYFCPSQAISQHSRNRERHAPRGNDLCPTIGTGLAPVAASGHLRLNWLGLARRRARGDHRSWHSISRLFREALRVSAVQAQGRQAVLLCRQRGGTFRPDGKRIKLPVIGWVRMREAVRSCGPLKRATVSCEAGRWLVSLLIETNDVPPAALPEAVVGIDLGVTTLATLSTGEMIEGPKAHAAALKRLRRANKAVARKRRGSRNARKAKARLTRLHRHVAAIRRDATHKLTTRVTKTYAVIGIEELNVHGMVRNHPLTRAVSDGGFHEFRRQIEGKARLYGARVVVADRWYPSSKSRSCCGVIKQTLALADRTFRCSACGFEAGDAARNLAAMAASSVVSACGAARSGEVRKVRVSRASAKQGKTLGGGMTDLERSSDISERKATTDRATTDRGVSASAW